MDALRVPRWLCLNEVRPGRPEQFDGPLVSSMERSRPGLNEVRPGRPEQFVLQTVLNDGIIGVSMKSGLEDRNNLCRDAKMTANIISVSMKSGLEDRNNREFATTPHGVE